MSALYGSLKGDRAKTEATRLGIKNISGHIRGWDVGINVLGIKREDGTVKLDVYLTGGSNGNSAEIYLGEAVVNKDGKPVFLKND